jgi:hypothetical protein
LKPPSTCGVALKEWAATVEALEQGSQILLLRKGGLREEGKEFKPLHHQFLLYPTFEHQREDLLKEEVRSDLGPALAQESDPGRVTFTHWARLEELWDEEGVARLSPHHIWTDDYSEKRLHWKPQKPLTLMLLRVYRLPEPRSVLYVAGYGGCKSWVQLEEEVSLGQMTPVMDQEDFQRALDGIKDTLEPAQASA